MNPSVESKKKKPSLISEVPKGDVEEDPEVMDAVRNVNLKFSSTSFSFLQSFSVRGDPLPSHPVRTAAVSDESGVQMRQT